MQDSNIAVKLMPDDALASYISGLWDEWRRSIDGILDISKETRAAVFATSIENTSSANMDTVNRTFIPKLADVYDTLQSNYQDALFSSPKFFTFDGNSTKDREKGIAITTLLRNKSEQKKFRQTTGRQIISDYVLYGNFFLDVSYEKEYNSYGELVYTGHVINRVSPLDITFDISATNFRSSPKIVRHLIHIADLKNFPKKFPSKKWDTALIEKLIKTRGADTRDQLIDERKKDNLRIDGFSTVSDYYSQPYVELLVYRGDVFDQDKVEISTGRKIYIIDRSHVILNEESDSPTGYDGLHHCAWRLRPDCLWGMSPLDNLLGMQWRINKIENTKADIYDHIAWPKPIVEGMTSNQMDPKSLYDPHTAMCLMGDERFRYESPNPVALSLSDSHMQQYFKSIEDFAGTPPESRGVRSPGEKTKAEFQGLDQRMSRVFKDKAEVAEGTIEQALREAYELTLQNFDSKDHIEIFDNIEQTQVIKELAKEDIKAIGSFSCIGSKHWDRKNKTKADLADLMVLLRQFPTMIAHVKGWNTIQAFESSYELEELDLFEQMAGAKEQADVQAITNAELSKYSKQTRGETLPQPGQAGAQEPQGQQAEQPGAGQVL